MPELQLRDIYSTVRVPLIGGTQASAGESGIVYSGDEWMLNCFPQSSINPVTGEKEMWITKRPGMRRGNADLTAILGSVNSYAVANISITALNDIYIAAIYDSTNNKYVIIQYRPVTLTSTKIGEITASATFGNRDRVFLTELTVANVSTLGVLWHSYDGVTSKGYYATSAAGVFTAASLTEITDVDFPPKAASPLPLVGPMIQMNGTTYVLTNTGEIHGSDLNSITAWNSLNMVQAISFPDQGVGLFRYKNYILAFGENSIEWFSDVGNPAPASALQRQDQAMIRFGAPNAKCITTLDDTIFWIGRSSSGTCGLWKMDGFEPIKVSGPIEDQVLESTLGQVDVSNYGQLCPISMLGQKHIIVAGSVSGMFSGLVAYADFTGDLNSFDQTTAYGNLTYSVTEQKFWYYRPYANSSELLAGSVPLAAAQYRLSNADPAYQYCIFSGQAAFSNGGAYYFRVDSGNNLWGDQGYTGTTLYKIPVVYQPNHIQFNNAMKKRIHKFKLIADPIYVANATGAESTSSLWFLWTKDFWTGNASPTPTPTVYSRDITVPNTTNRYFVTNLGAARTWRFGIVNYSSMPLKIQAIELDVSQGSQ